jgi:hypothetical protein
VSGYYGYSNGPTDTEELWAQIRTLRSKVQDLERELATHRHGYRWEPVGNDGVPYRGGDQPIDGEK